MSRNAFLDRARHSGVNPLVYWLVRATFQPFFHVYFRLSRIGREHIPQSGPIIFAANHRSFLDPFVIATMVRRPMYYVAKKELFSQRLQGWFLNSLGAFPIDRGNGDDDAMGTARAILERGDCVLIFPEGTRVRPGALGAPRRGVGRLALETGAPVVPLAVIGTERIRKGWRIRPHKVRIRAGRPLQFPAVKDPSADLARAVTDRIWPNVMLQWEWLGGLPPVRRAAVVGAGSWGTAIAVALQRSGIEVQLGCRTATQAAAIAADRGVNTRYLPGLTLPEELQIVRAADLDLASADLVVFAVPTMALPVAVAEHGAGVRSRAGVLVLSKGVVTDEGVTPVQYVAARVPTPAVGCLAGPGHAADAIANGASLVAASTDPAFLQQLKDVFATAGFRIETSTDVIGVELASTAKHAAVLAASAAAVAGPNAAGAAAGQVFGEISAYARTRGARPETFTGLAGAGDLVATVVDASSRNRRAGELLALGVARADIEPRLGQTAEALHVLPLLAAALEHDGVRAPAVAGLAAVVEGEQDAGEWAQAVTAPVKPSRVRRAA
ncbi:MAG: 1-acylglycerol-3-phosphate O-acyltransferase [Solirubrobacterales bacterium]|jgi:glycerol-3-phosphate dehydrogenase (NAD(P)+)|nr:1-acylglycerol-3-phosphate O-acyltransferase [Solirubrobacterales bacterium]